MVPNMSLIYKDSIFFRKNFPLFDIICWHVRYYSPMCCLLSGLYLTCWDFILLLFSIFPPKTIENNFQPNGNSHIWPEYLYLLFSNKFQKQFSSTQGFGTCLREFLIFFFFHFLFYISTSYSLDLMCTYF